MRMRLKHNLTSRLAKCDDMIIKINMTELNAAKAVLEKEYIDLNGIFGNDNPLYFDLGTGKGQFAIEFARRNPNINVIGVEIISNVIVDACEKARAENLPNLKFLNTAIEYIPKYFKSQSVSRIYLNFSTPKQKKSYANSRLTSPKFLKIYEYLLAPHAEIHQKTDDNDFFEYSLEQFQLYGYAVKELTRDLHDDPPKDNIVTEYEQNFVNQEKKINRLVAYLPDKTV
ncbi:MAG: tRNA (guanosine(46)-N7)-methyltransferase TrmB [Clostridia bacterium]